MYLLSISPFAKAFRKDLLWYFSSTPIDIGKIVTINLRGKNTKGLVLECKLAKDEKTTIRQSDFSIKKILGISKNQILKPEFILACQETANYFATSVGSVLNYLLPSNFSDFQIKGESVPQTKTGEGGAKFVVQLPDEERYSEYRSLIRGRFAKNQSVIFCLPTNEEAEVAKDRLSKGIESNTYTLTNEMTKTEILNTWNEIVSNIKPTLVIMTPTFMFTPFKNTGLIIIERENSRVYKTRVRPYFDIRYFSESYAKNLGADFLLGDLMLRAETLKRYDEHHFFEYTPIKFRHVGTAKSTLINTNKELNPSNSSFSTISFDLRALLKKSISQNKKSFLLVNRKGLASSIICADCGQIVKCNDCMAPVTLYGKDATRKNNFFKCRHCNASRGAGELCKNCKSWKLMPFGIGTEKVEEDIKAGLPDARTFILDKDHASTHQKARKIIESFNNEPAGILIGTEMALLYLRDEIDNTAVISIDALFGIPDYKTRERILNILLRTKDKARDNFVIQSRNCDDKIFSEAIEGNLSDFYREEFMLRKKYNYPPFSIMIKIDFKENTKDQLEKSIKKTEEILKPYELIIYDSFIEKVRGKFMMNGLIKIGREKWPDPELVEKLKNLPPNIDVVVDAESALG